MFRLSDLILLLVVFSSMLGGILFPEWASVFKPYPIYLMMLFLFLSFLSIRIGDVRDALRDRGLVILYLSFAKLILVPVGVYLIFTLVYPPYAASALLLTGISTGVVAPFIATLVQANGHLVLVMVVISSLLVPFTLPFLVQVLLGRTVEVSLVGMVRTLSMVIFLPVLAVETLRRAAPRAVEAVQRRRFPISLAIFAIINLGVFSGYSGFFLENPGTILRATCVAIGLGGIYLVVGLFLIRRANLEDRLASAIILGNMNNVLIIVLASEFFGPLESTVAAMYMIPFFGLILPLRGFAGRASP